MIASLQGGVQSMRKQAESLLDEQLEAEGASALESWIESLAFEAAAEKCLAAIQMMQEGLYITCDSVPTGVFHQEEYATVETFGMALSGQGVQVEVPIPYERFPHLRVMHESRRQLQRITAEERAYEFNQKPREERTAQFERHQSARRKLQETSNDGPDAYQRRMELREDLLPPLLFVNPLTYVARVHSRAGK